MMQNRFNPIESSLPPIMISQYQPHGGGAGVLLVHSRNGVKCVVAVLERGGAYSGQYNFPCGRHEYGTLRDTMIKEAHEEFTFHALTGSIPPETLDRAAKMRFGKGRATVVAAVELNGKISRAEVNKSLCRSIADPTLPNCYKEICKVELVPTTNILAAPDDGNSHQVKNLPDANGTEKTLTVSGFLIEVVHNFHCAGVI
jgi:hypothetical protein